METIICKSVNTFENKVIRHIIDDLESSTDDSDGSDEE